MTHTDTLRRALRAYDLAGPETPERAAALAAVLSAAHEVCDTVCTHVQRVSVPIELIEHTKHARRELCRTETAPFHMRQHLAQKLTDLLAAIAPGNTQ